MKKLNIQVYQGNPEELATKDNNNLFIDGNIEYTTGGGTKINSISSIKNSAGATIPISGGSGGGGSFDGYIINPISFSSDYYSLMINPEYKSLVSTIVQSNLDDVLNQIPASAMHVAFTKPAIAPPPEGLTNIYMQGYQSVESDPLCSKISSDSPLQIVGIVCDDVRLDPSDYGSMKVLFTETFLAGHVDYVTIGGESYAIISNGIVEVPSSFESYDDFESWFGQLWSQGIRPNYLQSQNFRLYYEPTR